MGEEALSNSLSPNMFEAITSSWREGLGPRFLWKILAKKKLDVVPATEPLNQITSHELVRGSNYIVKEPRAEFSFDIFTSLVKGKCAGCDHPGAFPCESIGCEGCTLACTCKECPHVRAQGLCFTLRSPEEIRQRYVLQTTPIFWISNHGAESISPTGLEIIAEMINRFLKKSRNPVIILDGIEYLVVSNGFVPVLKFLRDVEEWMVVDRAIFILPTNPAALEEKELALIERNMKELQAPKK